MSNSATRRKATVLGSGMVGMAIARDLALRGDLDVHIADLREDNLGRAAALAPVQTHRADLGDPAVVKGLIAESALVVGALPSWIGLQSVRVAIEAGCPMVDISFMPEDARPLDPLARERGAIVVTDAGVAPGLSNMMAAAAAAALDRCDRLEIGVGGLPAVRRWPFEYKAGFSPWDVLEEYTRPARVVEKGEMVVKEALSGLKLIDVPEIGTLESFITDGLRSLVDTVKVPNMEERTLRWPGHAALMKIFRETGLFSLDPINVKGVTLRPRDVTAALLFPKWTFDEGEEDITVMKVTAWGEKAGRAAVAGFDFFDRYDAESRLRSMSRSTGYTATAVASLILDGTIADPGVHMPETLALRPGLLDRVFEHLRARKIRCAMFT